jgi:hypothetical protein
MKTWPCFAWCVLFWTKLVKDRVIGSRYDSIPNYLLLRRPWGVAWAHGVRNLTIYVSRSLYARNAPCASVVLPFLCAIRGQRGKILFFFSFFGTFQRGAASRLDRASLYPLVLHGTGNSMIPLSRGRIIFFPSFFVLKEGVANVAAYLTESINERPRWTLLAFRVIARDADHILSWSDRADSHLWTLFFNWKKKSKFFFVFFFNVLPDHLLLNRWKIAETKAFEPLKSWHFCISNFLTW